MFEEQTEEKKTFLNINMIYFTVHIVFHQFIQQLHALMLTLISILQPKQVLSKVVLFGLEF